MAQNISIKEGGLSKQFGHINKLKISDQGGGTSLWVPEDDVKTETLYVDKNGTYYSDGRKTKYRYIKTKVNGKIITKKIPYTVYENPVYGWDEVNVNIINEVAGYKYDDYGDIDGYYDIGVDDEGFLEEEELPTSIKIIQPPNKTEYIIGEPINPDGMIVMAYYEDGSEYGEIPFGEYLLDPMAATKSGATSYTDGKGLNAVSCTAVKSPPAGYYRPNVKMFTHTDFLGAVGPNDESIDGASIIATIFEGKLYTIINYMGKICHGTGKNSFSRHNVYPTQSFHDEGIEVSRLGPNTIPESQAYPLYRSVDDLTAFVAVTVSWEREDGVALTDTFEISVTDPTPNI